MDMNIQSLPIVDLDDIVMDVSITNARHAYNLLERNELMNDNNESIRATKEKIEILCNEKLDGVIPSLLTSALDYPSPNERAVYNLVLCQYTKSKFMSVYSNSPEVQDIQSQLDKLNENFNQAYKNYLQAKNYPTVINTSGMNARLSVMTNRNGRLVPIVDPGLSTQSTTFNDDLSRAFKEAEAVSIEAKELYNKLKRKVDFNKTALTDEAVKDFADKSSKIAEPVATTTKEEDSRKIFSRLIRYAFSFKGEWANEETIIAISKLTD